MTLSRSGLVALPLVLLALPVPRAAAADAPSGERAVVARCVTATGTLLRREAEDKPWQVVAQGADVAAGDLLLGLTGAALESRDGSTRLAFRSDLTGTSPQPIIETAVVLHPAKGADLSFTLDRGRVDLTNRKASGAARVECRVAEGRGEIVLASPGSRVGLEIYGSWPAGVRFTKNPGPADRPALDLILIVLARDAEVKVGGRHFALHAPPGPALLQWDSVTGGDETPRRLDRLPEWAEAKDDSPQARERLAAQEQLRRLVTSKSLGAALDEFVASDDPARRRLAVAALGALDDLPRLGQALAGAKHADVRENGIRVMRHWIGRGPGQDQKLYRGLIEKAGYREKDAESVLQMLHTFGEEDRARPELYEALIDLLDHPRLPLRGLAHWHLVRLVPEGKTIRYDAQAPEADRAKAVAAWKKLVPEGSVPSARPAKP